MLCQARTEPASVAASLWISLPAVLSFLGWAHVTELAMDQHPMSLLVVCFGWLIICTVKCCLFSFARSWWYFRVFTPLTVTLLLILLGWPILLWCFSFKCFTSLHFLKPHCYCKHWRLYQSVLGFHLDVHRGHWNDTNLINAIFSW